MLRGIRPALIAVLGSLVTLTAVVGTACAAPAPAPAPALTEAQARQIGIDAYVYGTPLLEFLRQQRTQTSVTVPNSLSDAPINQIGNQRHLADAAHQVFVAPNDDTLYSMAHVDLSQGPLVLHLSAVPDHHYYVLEFLDPYTNVFHYVGTRTTGDRAGNYAIVGPTFHRRLPAGLHRIRSKYEHIWLCGRTLVYGPSGLGAAHKIQDGFKLVPLKAFEKVGVGYKAPRPKKVITTHRTALLPAGLAFFDALGDGLAQNPPPRRDHAILAELAKVGIGPGLRPSTDHLPAATAAGLKDAAAAGQSEIFILRAKLALASAAEHNGWFVAPPDIGNFGTDYKLRAVVAVNGLAANLPVEAMYPVGSFDSTGALLNGAHRYVIHIPASGYPPVHYYWSFTAYNVNLYLVSNPINRYAINQFTHDVKRNPDGSLDICLQATPPAGHESNWLPSPPAGQFEVILRMYGPKAAAVDNTYRYPSIIRVG